MAKKTAKHRKRIIDTLSMRENNTMAAVAVALEFIKGDVKRCGPDLTLDVVKGRLERALRWYELDQREEDTLSAARNALKHINNTALLGRAVVRARDILSDPNGCTSISQEAIENYLKKTLKVYKLTKSDIEWYKIPTIAEQPAALPEGKCYRGEDSLV